MDDENDDVARGYRSAWLGQDEKLRKARAERDGAFVAVERWRTDYDNEQMRSLSLRTGLLLTWLFVAQGLLIWGLS
jgi:hypothetical protein